MRSSWLALLAALSLAGACRNSAAKHQGGQLVVRWTGADTGEMSAPAAAEWCDGQRRLEVRAIRGDTGLALAIFPPVVLAPDTYRVIAPITADSVAPSARVALRWFAPTLIKGFQGDSGVVVLDRTDSGGLSGSILARASSVSNTERVTVTGEFRNLDVFEQVRGCLPESVLDTAEQQLEPGDTDEVD